MLNNWQIDLNGLVLSGWLYQPDQQESDVPMAVARHGWLDNANSWLPLAKSCPKFPILAFDWPGHGQSEHLPATANYHFIDWADILYQVVDSLDQQVILVGHSMGALVNTLVAASFPELVESLVLVEGLGPLTAEPTQTSTMLRKGLLSRKRMRHKQATEYDSTLSAIAARKAASPDLTTALIEPLVERNLKTTGANVQWQYDPRVKCFSPLRMTESQAKQLILSIDCPVMAILADSGFPELKTLLEQRRHYFRRLQVVELAGGHHVHMTKPKELASLIESFAFK